MKKAEKIIINKMFIVLDKLIDNRPLQLELNKEINKL